MSAQEGQNRTCGPDEWKAESDPIAVICPQLVLAASWYGLTPSPATRWTATLGREGPDREEAENGPREAA